MVFTKFQIACGCSHLQTDCKRSVEEGIRGTVVAQSSTRGLWDWRFLYINFLCMVACLCSLYKLKGKIIHDIITDIGFKIKKGWNINIDARSIHHDPTLQNDPDVFNPSRFPVSLSIHFIASPWNDSITLSLASLSTCRADTFACSFFSHCPWLAARFSFSLYWSMIDNMFSSVLLSCLVKLL